MSEIIVAPGTTTPQFGLDVDSTQPILLEQLTPGGTITATGGTANDSIVPIDLASLTPVEASGAAGDDVLAGAAGDDVLEGGLGGDSLVGNSGNDAIVGGGGADVIEGGAGADVINAGGGADTITPGAGRNVVTTGGGADTIRFEADSAQGGLTRITDFSRQDTIEISRQLLRGSGLGRGTLSSDDFQSVQSIRDLDDEEAATIIYERRTGIVYFNRENGADVRLFRLEPNLNINASDFEVF